jgi:hypothetical protein
MCNHAGWKMGGSRDKYIKYESAGDQFLGRVVCGLDPLLQSFAISPPFSNMCAEELEGIESLLMSFVVSGSGIPAAMFEVL